MSGNPNASADQASPPRNAQALAHGIVHDNATATGMPGRVSQLGKREVRASKIRRATAQGKKRRRNEEFGTSRRLASGADSASPEHRRK